MLGPTTHDYYCLNCYVLYKFALPQELTNTQPARSSSSSRAPGPWITCAVCLYDPQPSPFFCVFCLFLYFLRPAWSPGFFRKTAVVNPVPVKLCNCFLGKGKQEESLCDPIPFPNSRSTLQSGWALERTHTGDPYSNEHCPLTGSAVPMLEHRWETEAERKWTGLCPLPLRGKLVWALLHPHPWATTSARLAMMGTTCTFVQHGAKDGQAVVDGRAVPTAATELVLALLDADFDALCHAGHDLHVVPAETQLLGY